MYDLAIIGGGINGTAIARDAAGRGAKVILIERGDLARGTSSASTKLIHGGLRYLEYYEFALVRESLIEREKLWGIAPHIAHPMRFMLPHHKGLRPRWLLRLGLFMYDHMGGRKHLPATRSVDLRHDPAGASLKPEFTHAFEYSDCWVDDARMTLLNAKDAAEHGATIWTRREVTGLKRDDGFWRIDVAGEAESVLAKIAVNAAGPAVLDLLERTKGHVRDAAERIRLVRGSHIVVPKMFDSPQAYFCQNADGRIFFAIPYEGAFTLIGTTDADHDGSLDAVHATLEEIAYLCASANDYFRQTISPSDVIWSYAGVRPLVDDGSGKPEAASRGYHFEIDAQDGAALLSVFGGKITTNRHLAENAVRELAAYLPMLRGSGWTAGKPLPGGEFGIDGFADFRDALAADYPFIDDAIITRIAKAYGTRARQWLGEANSLTELGADFGHGLTAAEIDYMVSQEWARTSDDILWRRSKLGLHFSTAEQEKLTAYLARNESFG